MIAKHFKIPKLRNLIVAGIVGGTVAIGLAVWTLWGRFSTMMIPPSALDAIPGEPVAIVFGAGYWSDGTLSMILKDRLDAALELYEAGKVQKLLFSGDNRFVDYNEPGKMLEYALAHGIPRR